MSIHVPLHVQQETVAHLRASGKDGSEGLVVWSGFQFQTKDCKVSTAVIPKGLVFRHYSNLRFSDEALESIADEILSRGEKLIAQVHTHPRKAFHSIIDDRYPIIHRQGFLSIVLPYFARDGFSKLDGIRIYEYAGNNTWYEFDQKGVRGSLKIEVNHGAY
jgi:hypothetical protein